MDTNPGISGDESQQEASSSTTRPGFKPGDWAYPSCQAHNFLSRTACFKCSIPKPTEFGPGGPVPPLMGREEVRGSVA